MIEDEAIIAVHKATRRFGRTVAVDAVSLAVQRGELFGVVGPDGAGKTTLLRMMAAVLDPSGPGARTLRDRVGAVLHPAGGDITVLGCDTVHQAEAVKARLGYMPQQFGLYGDLSVDENLAFAADIWGIDGEARRERIHQLLAFAGLEQFRGRRAALLSGGMKKKLALACALLSRPEVLLLDEPTTGVDPVARRDFWDLLSGLHAEGITAVVSTPYMDEAERCNRVALLFEGRVLACDAPAAIKQRVPGYVLARYGPDVRAATEALRGLPGLLDVQTYGDQLSLIIEESKTVEAARTAIHSRLKMRGLPTGRLEPAPVRMEEAFIYLVGEARRRGAAT